jgi:hypothetical protein
MRSQRQPIAGVLKRLAESGFDGIRDSLFDVAEYRRPELVPYSPRRAGGDRVLGQPC